MHTTALRLSERLHSELGKRLQENRPEGTQIRTAGHLQLRHRLRQSGQEVPCTKMSTALQDSGLTAEGAEEPVSYMHTELASTPQFV